MRSAKAEPVTQARPKEAAAVPVPVSASASPPSSLSIPPRPFGRLPCALGRYELLFRVGSGGMGTVYAGRLSSTHGFERLVAIKVMDAAGDEAARAAFVKEARLAARLAHRNVVGAIDFGESDDGVLFIVMDLVVGVSLSALLNGLHAKRERLDPHLAAWIAAQVADGLDAAHDLRDTSSGAALGLVHRDVSPQNILLGFDGRVTVTDFGIAKLASGSGGGTGDSTTGDGLVKGKLSYMSPEQLTGRPVDRRSDIFSLGIVLYEALSGKRLFVAETPGTLALSILNQRIAPLDDGAVPHELASIAARCLERNPEERFATAREVGDALRAIVRGHAEMEGDRMLASVLDERCADAKERFDADLRSARSAAMAMAMAATTTTTTTPDEPAASASPSQTKPPSRSRLRVMLLLGLLLFPLLVATAVVVARRSSVAAPKPNESSATPQPPADSPSTTATREEASATTPSSRAPTLANPDHPRPGVPPPHRAPRSTAPPASGGVFRSLH